MSDYRNPNDPSWRDSPYDLNARTGNATSGWIAGGVFLLILIGLAFGVGHMPNHGNNNSVANNTPPPTTQPAPTGPATHTFSPTPMSPAQSPTRTPVPDSTPAQP
jgi:uncharacterized iron-regulated membrane protein